MKKSKFCECCGKEFYPKQHFKKLNINTEAF